MRKFLVGVITFMLIAGFAVSASAYYFEAGDAADQASADVILDIVFVADTSASMYDELDAISSTVYSIVDNIDCPDCDAWVRASFMNINGYSSGYFNTSVTTLVTGQGGTPISNHQEDNGPAVTDLVNWYNWKDDSTGDQDYYMAIVTIGDEGTEDGYPVYANDWAAAYVANQAAIANGIMVFSLVGTVYPSSGYIADQPNRDAVFTAMAEGGSGEGYTLGDTGGLAIFTTSNTLEGDIENIICTASGGGTDVPEPGTGLLIIMGLIGLAGVGRKKIRK
jgi:hypothetical protein